MGLFRYESADGTQNLLSFDTKRVSIYNTATERFDPLDAADIFSSTGDDFIWVTD